MGARSTVCLNARSDTAPFASNNPAWLGHVVRAAFLDKKQRFFGRREKVFPRAIDHAQSINP
jgi:hypothetical protein